MKREDGCVCGNMKKMDKKRKKECVCVPMKIGRVK
jgi:hypothetical protein